MSEMTQEEMLAAAEAASDGAEAVDLSDVQELHAGVLEAGRYDCEVIDVKIDTVKGGKNKGHKKFVLRFKPFKPESNKALFVHAPFTGPSAGYTKAKLNALGVDTSQKIVPHTILGSRATLVVSVRDVLDADGNATGKRDNDIEEILPYVSGDAEAASELQ